MGSKYPHKEIEYTWIRDRGGSTLKLQKFEGLQYYPTYPPRVLQGMKQVKLRPDDIFLTTFQRTGTHWVFEMISMLLNQKAETIPANKEKSQIEFESNDSLSALPSPRVINTHMSLVDSPKELVEKKCKIIFTLRDPKDVAVSMYHFYTGFKKETDYVGTFSDFLHLFLDGKVDCGGLFRHWRSSEEFLDNHPDIPVHFMVFEESFENPVLALQKLSDFLGLTRNDTLCQQIAEQCHIAKMKAGKTFTSETNKLLYRKGVVGDWRNYFTEEMLEEYYRVYEEKMAGSRFYHRYAKEELPSQKGPL